MMNDPVPTVFVVDDNEAVRSAVSMLLRTVGLPAETFASAGEFLGAFLPDRPGCLVLDIRMAGMSGLDLQKELVRQGSLLPVIFVTGHGDVTMAVRAMQDGAVDFIEKPFREEDLLQRIRKALTKNEELRQDARERDDVRARIGTLTRREREVMERVVNGDPNKAIAVELSISERTVEVHRAHVMEKMRATSLAHLVRLVLRAGP
jgi:FixJ family two-component response regulator